MNDNFNEGLDDEELGKVVLAFLEHTLPIEWVDWMYKCTDSESQNKLREALFDGDRLKSLVDPSVRSKALEVINTTPALRELVIRQIVQELEKEHNPSEDAP